MFLGSPTLGALETIVGPDAGLESSGELRLKQNDGGRGLFEVFHHSPEKSEVGQPAADGEA
jgi:hypothetical protein